MARGIAAGIGMVLACAAAVAEPVAACPGAAHRFETFTLPAPALGRPKRVLVYLPPGYGCEVHRRYPVFYLNDGHDLFDWSPDAPELDPALAAEIAAREAWYGSWRLDAQLDQAMADGHLPPIIIVGIASDDGQRSRDLASVPWDGSSEARGREYGSFVARTVVSAVDGRYRTARDRRCRGIGGASLGGVSAMDIGLGYPDTFGLAFAFSPLLADPSLAAHVAANLSAAGGRPQPDLLVDFDDDVRGAADRGWFAFLSSTVTNHIGTLILQQSSGGRHSIASWAERIVPALRQLVTARCPAVVS